MAFVRKPCGGKFGWSVLADSLPKLIFGTLRYSSTLTSSQLCWHKFETLKKKIMVSMRRGDYSMPEKNPPRPLECSPALRRPGNEEDEAKEGKAISAAVDYATLLTFNDEQHANKNDVAAGGNNNSDGKNCGMNDDDGGDDRGMHNNEGDQQVKEEMGEAWEKVTKKHKSQMSNNELRTCFDSQLRGVGECPNPSCNCVAIIADRDDVRVCMLVQCKTKYEQDLIVFEWLKYSSYLRKSSSKVSKITLFCLPFINDGTVVVPDAVCTHVLCSQGLCLVLNWGSSRWQSIRNTSTVTGVMPMHCDKW